VRAGGFTDQDRIMARMDWIVKSRNRWAGGRFNPRRHAGFLGIGLRTLQGNAEGKIVIGTAILLAVAVDRLAERWRGARGAAP
jgi:hypothetical protein